MTNGKRTRIDTMMEGIEESLFRREYATLQQRCPEHEMLGVVSVTDKAIHVEQGFFEHYRYEPLKIAVPKYFMALKIENAF